MELGEWARIPAILGRNEIREGAGTYIGGSRASGHARTVGWWQEFISDTAASVASNSETKGVGVGKKTEMVGAHSVGG